jgi:hypothetical protein
MRPAAPQKRPASARKPTASHPPPAAPPAGAAAARGGACVAVPLRTVSALNAREVWQARARRVKRECGAVAWALLAAQLPQPALPVTVTLTRVAPSNGVDPHDGLGAALKGCIDEVARFLRVDDRDPRVRWVLAQRRGARGEWLVEIDVRPLAERE